MVFNPVSRVLFPTPPSSYDANSFPGNLLWVPRSLNPQTAAPEDCVPFLLFKHERANMLVIYFHSNAEDLGRCYDFCCTLSKQLKVHVLVVEYPSYGICPGSHCDEQGATDSALTALRFAREILRWPLERIILFGRSIGTGPAISLATQLEALCGLILVCPFTSIREVCKDVLGPVSYLINERFPNLERVQKVKCPCLIVHGQKDSLIPLRHGRELYDACQSRKRLVMPVDMDHNDSLLADPRWFANPLIDFFQLTAKKVRGLDIPNWVFDKRLCPQYLQQIGALVNDANTTCSVCSTSRPARQRVQFQQAEAKPEAGKVRRTSSHAEEVIANAVEGALASKEVKQFWAEMERTLELENTGDSQDVQMTKQGVLPPSGPPNSVLHSNRPSSAGGRQHAPKVASTALLPVLGDVTKQHFAVHVTSEPRRHRSHKAKDDAEASSSETEPDFDFVVVSDSQETVSEKHLNSSTPPAQAATASPRKGSPSKLQAEWERGASFEFDLDVDVDCEDPSDVKESEPRPVYKPLVANLTRVAASKYEKSPQTVGLLKEPNCPRPKARVSKAGHMPPSQRPVEPAPFDDEPDPCDSDASEGKYMIV
mmetsp:Transcript_39139/g.92076  ORF Transcript_39139/g.92076 Transcript_39139/m.92076 type:complete len:597 (+) Transcript_39139:115-1905(+)